MNYEENIGKRVEKSASGKPFKSGLKFNTVKAVINHPILGVPAYTFEEDDTYVECRRCSVEGESPVTFHQQSILKSVAKMGAITMTVEQGIGKYKIK